MAKMNRAQFVKMIAQRKAQKKGKKPPLGTGQRFAAVQASARKSGARNPAAVAAMAGRKKYGNKRFARMAAAGRRRA